MIRIDFRGKFEREYEELTLENQEIKKLILKKIELFEKNPEDTRLDNHALKKKMKGKWAFSITGDIRIVHKWTGKKTVRFLAIGPHIKVYKN